MRKSCPFNAKTDVRVCVRASLIPVSQVQIIFAVAVMMATVWYQTDLDDA
jgi:hypothetical protein